MIEVHAIDAHHHLWDLDALSYPWLVMDPPPQLVCGDIGPIRKNYTIENYQQDIAENHIVKSVAIEAGNADPLAETRWLQQLADRHGFPHAIVVGAQLDDPDLFAVLEGHLEYPNVRGVRQIIAAHDDPVFNQTDRSDYLRDPTWRRGFGSLARYGMLFDLQIYPGQTTDVEDLLKKYSEVEIVLEHAGMPADRHEGAFYEWSSALQRLSAFPTVTVKISGLGMSDHSWTVDTIRPYVLQVIETFGPSRCMFGSNFPVDRLYTGYSEIWEAFRTITMDFSNAERQQLFNETAARVYRL